MATVEVYGTAVEFDPSREYAGYNSKCQLGTFVVERTLQRISQLGSKAEAIKALEAMVKHFQISEQKQQMLEGIIQEGVLYLANGLGGRGCLITSEQEKALQNSVDLLAYAAQALRS